MRVKLFFLWLILIGGYLLLKCQLNKSAISNYLFSFYFILCWIKKFNRFLSFSFFFFVFSSLFFILMKMTVHFPFENKIIPHNLYNSNNIFFSGFYLFYIIAYTFSVFFLLYIRSKCIDRFSSFILFFFFLKTNNKNV